MKWMGMAGAFAAALCIAGTPAAAADDKINWESCRVLVNQYDKLDTSKLEASMKIRADSLMKKGESLCLRDRYEHGVEAMREALDVVGVKPKI